MHLRGAIERCSDMSIPAYSNIRRLLVNFRRLSSITGYALCDYFLFGKGESLVYIHASDIYVELSIDLKSGSYQRLSTIFRLLFEEV